MSFRRRRKKRGEEDEEEGEGAEREILNHEKMRRLLVEILTLRMLMVRAEMEATCY